MSWVKDFWIVLRRIERLSELEAVQNAAIEEMKHPFAELQQQFRNLGKRIQRLEDRQDIVIDQAKSAARDASSQSTQNVIGDLARRIGALKATKRPRKPKQVE